MYNENLTGTDTTSPKWVLDLKSTVRPFLTYLFTLLYTYAFITKVDMERFGSLTNIMILIIVFWFGDRVLKNLGGADVLKALLTKRKENEKS